MQAFVLPLLRTELWRAKPLPSTLQVLPLLGVVEAGPAAGLTAAGTGTHSTLCSPGLWSVARVTGV